MVDNYYLRNGTGLALIAEQLIILNVLLFLICAKKKKNYFVTTMKIHNNKLF